MKENYSLSLSVAKVQLFFHILVSIRLNIILICIIY
nr:MAG TPA: hypothetical protein [Microviridae sp.]